MPGKKILIIDDDIALLRGLERVFIKTGYQVYTSNDGVEGLRQLYHHQPDVVILDILLPVMDGWETCRRIRQLCNVPIIIITGAWSEEENIASLREGADEYLPKPFNLDILLAKVEVLLRRAGLAVSRETSLCYYDHYLAIDLATHEVFVQGQPVYLSPKEYELLAYLVRHAGQIIPHQQLLRDVWNLAGPDHVRNVHLYIRRLRQKVEVDPRQPDYILTMPRIGYRFKKQSQA